MTIAIEAFTYTSRTTPKGYVCGTCGATGCRLFRDYQTFLDHQSLACLECAAKGQKEDVSTIDTSRLDQIGWRVAAVPTEDGTTFWGYTSVPQAGCDWWCALPVCAPKAAP